MPGTLLGTNTSVTQEEASSPLFYPYKGRLEAK